MKGRGNGSGGPEDVDAAFAEIIAGLESEGVGRDVPGEQTPETTEPSEPPKTSDAADDSDVDGGGTATAGWRAGTAEFDPTWSALDDLDDQDEHYQPPEPPPLPKPRRATIIVLIFIGLGLLLLVAPGLLGLSSTIATPIALLAITCGLGFFVLSKRHGGPPPGADSDGAQV